MSTDSRTLKKRKQPGKATRPEAKTRAARPPQSAIRTSHSALRTPHLKGTDPVRVKEILRRLDEMYPAAVCALRHENAWQLLVATILSAQCTDARVNMVTPDLFLKYPTVQDFAALRPELLEPDIRSTGFFRNKARSIVGAAKKIVSDFSGKVPRAMEELLTLPGVARKTANVVLGTAFGLSTGIVVDTHVHRISRRLDLTRNDDPNKIERDLMKIIPDNKWIAFSHQVIWHGRQRCVARRPHCGDCLLDPICYAPDKWKAEKP